MVDKANYEVDLNDKALTDVTAKSDKAVADLEQVYSGMMNQSDAFYQKQIDAAEQWGATQSALQQERTDFTIEQIEQQKAQAKKDYTKEQSGAYVDWQKQSNEYGANAEAMAAQGMAGSGYSESSQVSMYNTYQNRVAMARDSFDRAILNYNNSITEARIANNAALAEIAYNTLQKTLELSLQGFQYKNQLVSELADKKLQTQSYWQSVYKDVLAQLNTEADRAFKVDSHNESMAETKRQHDAEMAYKNAALQLEKDKFAYQKEQAAKAATISKSSSSGRSSGSKKSSSKKSSAKSVNVSSAIKSNRSKTGGKKSFSTYSEAAAYLNKNGISGDGGLMTKSEWTRRKNSGSDRAPAGYSSYEVYLENYVTWKLQNPD